MSIDKLDEIWEDLSEIEKIGLSVIIQIIIERNLGPNTSKECIKQVLEIAGKAYKAACSRYEDTEKNLTLNSYAYFFVKREILLFYEKYKELEVNSDDSKVKAKIVTDK